MTVQCPTHLWMQNPNITPRRPHATCLGTIPWAVNSTQGHRLMGKPTHSASRPLPRRMWEGITHPISSAPPPPFQQPLEVPLVLGPNRQGVRDGRRVVQGDAAPPTLGGSHLETPRLLTPLSPPADSSTCPRAPPGQRPRQVHQQVQEGGNPGGVEWVHPPPADGPTDAHLRGSHTRVTVALPISLLPNGLLRVFRTHYSP